jgi:hypothetical protein
MNALGIFLFLGCCLFVAYLAHRTPAKRVHSRILLAAMLGILVIAIDRDDWTFSFMFWAALTICWTAGVILAASEMFGRLLGWLRESLFKVDSPKSVSPQETVVVPTRNPPLAP